MDKIWMHKLIKDKWAKKVAAFSVLYGLNWTYIGIWTGELDSTVIGFHNEGVNYGKSE